MRAFALVVIAATACVRNHVCEVRGRIVTEDGRRGIPCIVEEFWGARNTGVVTGTRTEETFSHPVYLLSDEKSSPRLVITCGETYEVLLQNIAPKPGELNLGTLTVKKWRGEGRSRG
jgi:hypothetical protein